MKKLTVVIILLAVIALVGLVWYKNGFRAPDADNTEKISFVVEPGQTVRSIGKELKDAGLIKDPTVFFIYTRQAGIDTDIQAGSYVLSPSMNLNEIVDALQSGSIDIWVRIPEGARAEEVAEILEQQLPTYDSSWDVILKQNEGRLFPDTYLIAKDATITDVMNTINNNFIARLDSIGLSPDNPNLERILTIASLIEREAKLPEDRALVAGVIENRLDEGMPLQIDASAQYAVGKPGNWWKTPTPNDLKVDSPYNTYANPGLPPGPIASPGLASIEAAANPKSSTYLFYVNDENGKLHFTETFEAHNDNIEKHLQ